MPITQRPVRGVTVVLEPSRDMAAATRVFTQSLRAVDPLIPVSAMTPIKEPIGSSVALPRLYASQAYFLGPEPGVLGIHAGVPFSN